MFYFILAGIVLSLLLRRNPLTVLAVPIKYPFLLIGILFVQVIIALIASIKHVQYPSILIITFVGMLVALFLNRHIYGIKLILIGTFFNTMALILHNGLMPVSERAMELAGLADLSFHSDSRHQVMEQSLFWWLGDWIPLLSPVGTNYVWSPGDFMVALGILLFLVRNSKRGKLE